MKKYVVELTGMSHNDEVTRYEKFESLQKAKEFSKSFSCQVYTKIYMVEDNKWMEMTDEQV